MRIGGSAPSGIEPVSAAPEIRDERPSAADTRNREAANDRRPGTALVAVGRATATPPPSRTAGASSLLNAQLIAQGLPTRSERRLARQFPDRAIAAYRRHAALLDDDARKRHRRTA
jgi:hypothetical protein